MSWVGFDLDGTLATFPHAGNGWAVGEPIGPIVQIARTLIKRGVDVRIFTARVSPSLPEEYRLEAIEMIEAWCERHLGRKLPVTASKDFEMVAYFDDCAISVGRNSGKILGGDLKLLP